MNIDNLKKAQARLEEKIINFAKANNLSNANVEPILDGIVDISKYSNAKIKILWILKEPYDDKDNSGLPYGGGWSITNLVAKNPKKMVSSGQVFKRIAYVSYGILKNCEWKKMDYIEQNPEIAEALKSIAYINVGKMPNFTTTSDSRLKKIYRTWKDILFEQISAYSPDVIIFGNTFNVFAADIFSDDIPQHKVIRRSSGDFVGIYHLNKKILLDVYHPSAIVSDDDYVESILESVGV